MSHHAPNASPSRSACFAKPNPEVAWVWRPPGERSWAIRLWPVWSLSRALAQSRLVSHGAERGGRNEAAPCGWNKAGFPSPTGLPPRVWVQATLDKSPAGPIAPKFSWTSPLLFGWTIHPSRAGQTPITYSCACNDDIGHQRHAGFNPLHERICAVSQSASCDLPWLCLPVNSLHVCKC